MTELLTKAIKAAEKLSEEEQDALGSQWLADIQDEMKWSESFKNSQDALAKLADKALEDYKSGKTKEMGFDEL